MADKTVGELPQVSELYDDSLFVAEQSGQAVSVPGSVLKKYAGGGTGSPGGYYTPSVTQPTTDTMKVSYTPSASDMPSVVDVTVNLPKGKDGNTPVKGKDYWTDEDKTEIVADCVNETAPPIVLSASGEEITLTDSAERPLKGLKLYGKTTQRTYDGKDLFNGDIVPGWINTSNGSINNDARSVRSADFIPVISGRAITISNDKGYYTYVFEYDANKAFIKYARQMNGNPCTVTLGETTAYIMFRSDQGTVQSDLSVKYTVVYGDGTAFPSPEKPEYPVSVGESGTINVSVNEQILLVSTPNGLPGIPDDTYGNYTDSNGQKWCCDEIDFARGVYVQRVCRYIIDGTEDVAEYRQGSYDDAIMGYPIIGVELYLPNLRSEYGFCSHFMSGEYDLSADNPVIHYNSVTVIFYSKEIMGYGGKTDGSGWIDYMQDQIAAGTPVTVWYRLAEPIETALTAEELTAYAALHTNKPTTVITNDAGAEMDVEYVAETKTYIDNQIAAMFAELSAALLNS